MKFMLLKTYAMCKHSLVITIMNLNVIDAERVFESV